MKATTKEFSMPMINVLEREVLQASSELWRSIDDIQILTERLKDVRNGSDTLENVLKDPKWKEH